MDNKQPIIQFKNIDQHTFPHYYHYGIAIEKIKDVLFDETGHPFNLYTTDEGLEELDSIIEGLIKQKSKELQIVATIFDHVTNSTVHYSNEEKFSITASVSNNLFYFPTYEVAFARIPIYQSHADFEMEFIFATKDSSLLTFANDMMEKQRTLMLDGITTLVDTEDGLERAKENITDQIKREDVLLEESIKKDIFRSIDEFFVNKGNFYRKYNIPYKRGILLYGNPGNGKTTLVKSIAGSVTAPVIYWQITQFTSSYSIQEVFSTVTKLAPVILIIEDIDSMPYDARSVFLNTLDGATSKEGIFLIGTTNYPEKIDPALINRAGRFDRAYEIKQPNETFRKRYLTKKGIEQFIQKIDVDSLGSKTKGLSIAQLNELYMSVALQWHYEQHVDVDKVVQELQENNRKSMKQDWDMEDYEDQMGF